MRAILIATSIVSPSRGTGVADCSPLSPLVDRPFLHHVIGSIMDFGVDEVHFALLEGSEFVEQLLGGGQRWGGTFHYHYLPSSQPVYSRLKAFFAPRGVGEIILLAQADRLPAIDRQMAEPPISPTFLMTCDDVPEWTGWALMSYRMLLDVPPDSDVSGCFQAWREQTKQDARFFPMQGSLMASSFEQLLHAQHRVLSKMHGGLVLTGREVENQVWMGRNANVHRTAKLISPVYIGENCRIGSQTQLGPGVALGRGSVVDRFSTVKNSLVFADSYIGQGLEVRDAIVSGNHLLNTRIGAEIQDFDHILLTHISGPPFGDWLGICSDCVLAAVLLVIALPVLLWMLLRTLVGVRGWPLEACALLAQPAARRPERWRSFRQWRFKDEAESRARQPRRHFVSVFLPGLWNVMRGDLSMVGPRPLTFDEARRLGAEQPEQLRRKPGLIHPGLWSLAEDNVSMKSATLSKKELWSQYLSALRTGRYAGAPR